jgi:hypothetical protein
MGTKPTDATTQTAASQAAQQASATQAANAATAQTNSNNQETSLFGTYNPATGTYSGGSESAALSPSSEDTTGLTGSYSNLYNTQANTTAQGAQNSVSTAEQNAASHGMGKSPAGYTADQQRQAYQTQAGQNATNYSTDFGAQHQEAVNAYNTANGLLATSQNNNQNSATANNANAAGTNTSLYGTASQQVPTALGTALSTVTGLAGGAAGGSAITKYCWIAAEIYGGWHEPRTIAIRQWLHENFDGHWLLDLYIRFGERIAETVRHRRSVRWLFTRIFNQFLRQARKGA